MKKIVAVILIVALASALVIIATGTILNRDSGDNSSSHHVDSAESFLDGNSEEESASQDESKSDSLPKKYTITLLVDKEDWMGSTVIYCEENEEFELLAPIKDGFNFAFYKDQDGNEYQAGTVYHFNFGKDLVLTPVFNSAQ